MNKWLFGVFLLLIGFTSLWGHQEPGYLQISELLSAASSPQRRGHYPPRAGYHGGRPSERRGYEGRSEDADDEGLPGPPRSGHHGRPQKGGRDFDEEHIPHGGGPLGGRRDGGPPGFEVDERDEGPHGRWEPGEGGHGGRRGEGGGRRRRRRRKDKKEHEEPEMSYAETQRVQYVTALVSLILVFVL
ncbi:unnamed protein product [Calicophoron daubneyi]|uniref:Uncharacterized protein n=1 Tax=Calicophoron daubneyi TaxID=300641 RepID=A0AAV2THM3_CALDB